MDKQKKEKDVIIMKISDNTLNILKWMTTINGGIKIDAGNKIFSKSITNAMVAYVEVDEEFPYAFVTANLQKFLSTVGLFDDPEFEFTEKYVVISSTNGKNKSRFYLSDPSCVNDQTNRLPKPQNEVALSFHIKSDDLQKIFKAASVMNVSELCIRAHEGMIKVSCLKKDEDTTNSFDIIVGECDPELEQTFYFKKNYFKINTEFSYDAEIYSTGLSKFSATDSPFKQFDVYAVTLFDNKD